MWLDSFVGSEGIRLSLSAAIAADKLSHSLVIVGKRGFGINHFARLLAADILKADLHQKELILKGESPLVQTVVGEGASGQIKVEKIRKINENVNFSFLSGEKRIIIIENCENFNQSSANSLLKNLEEPKDDITFILTTNDISQMLATIRSRCGVYTLAAPSPLQCKSFFSFVKDSRQLDEVIRIYDGNIGLIQSALGDSKRLLILQRAISAMELIEKRDKYELSKLLFAFNKKRDDFRLFLEDLEYLSQKDIDETSVKTLGAIHGLSRGFSSNASLALLMQSFVVAV